MVVKKVNVIDLDKTLIGYDSFNILVRKQIQRFDLRITLLTIFRLFRIINSYDFKRKVTGYMESKFDESYFRRYADQIFEDVDVEVMRLVITESDSSTDNVLLSASPDCYVKFLLEKLKWSGSGSYFNKSDGEFIHLHGKGKVDWILNNYNENEYTYNFCISDSDSDNTLLARFKTGIKWTSQ